MKISSCLGSAGMIGLTMLAVTASAQEFKLKLVSEGASKKDLNGYMPTHITLSETAPSNIKHAPAGLKAPLYGTLKLGPTDSQHEFGIIVDEPAEGTARLFVDADGNGMYKDNQPTKWTTAARKRSDGKEGVFYNGDGTVNFKLGSETLPLHFNFYRFDKNDPGRAAQKLELFYYRDYEQEGQITLNGKSYRVVLDDLGNRGSFLPEPANKAAVVKMWIDVNGDGKFDSAVESWNLGEPFNIKGSSYVAKVSNPMGTKLVIEPSKVAAEERKPQDVGDPVFTFNAKTTQNKPVSFPSDYKGKLVMLDFWATWCGPCIAEMPNLSAVYKDYHAKGFEVLGVSLDDKIPAKQVEDFAADKGLTWNQVYEGGRWETRLAKYYRVHSIPHTLLVDGDSGEILAMDNDLRGTKLAPTLDKMIAKKFKN